MIESNSTKQHKATISNNILSNVIPGPLCHPLRIGLFTAIISLFKVQFQQNYLLIHTGVPGGNANTPLWRIPIVSEYIWVTGQRKKQPEQYCKSGYIVHNICIMTSADLSSVHRQVNVNKLRGPMFHNKYFMERDHTVMDCLEEQLVVRNKLEYEKDCLA